MLNGWNRKVRITSAIRRAWITTRIVSPTPLSVFVPEVTLIALSIPAGGHSAPPSRERARRFASQGDCPDSDNEGQFRRKAEFAQADLRPRTFRRLSEATQSRNASKLYKSLTFNANYKIAGD